jgi:hypothetical protein
VLSTGDQAIVDILPTLLDEPLAGESQSTDPNLETP